MFQEFRYTRIIWNFLRIIFFISLSLSQTTNKILLNAIQISSQKLNLQLNSFLLRNLFRDNIIMDMCIHIYMLTIIHQLIITIIIYYYCILLYTIVKN